MGVWKNLNIGHNNLTKLTMNTSIIEELLILSFEIEISKW
jgi:hypothetical protein